MKPAEIERRFVYHPPDDATRVLHDQVRELTLGFATAISTLLDDPDDPGVTLNGVTSRELACAYTSLEEASFWLHAHIARNVGRDTTR